MIHHQTRGSMTPVCWWVRANVKLWIKLAQQIDPEYGNGYGVLGPFIVSKGAHAEGTMMVIGMREHFCGGETVAYLALRVRHDVCMTRCITRIWRINTAREVWGEWREIVATSRDKVDSQQIVDKWPDLAPAVGTKMLPIYAALRGAGL